jgi:hypothetical protein
MGRNVWQKAVKIAMGLVFSKENKLYKVVRIIWKYLKL